MLNLRGTFQKAASSARSYIVESFSQGKSSGKMAQMVSDMSMIRDQFGLKDSVSRAMGGVLPLLTKETQAIVRAELKGKDLPATRSYSGPIDSEAIAQISAACSDRCESEYIYLIRAHLIRNFST